MGNLYSAHTILEVIFVRIDTNALVAMTEANQNFSRVARLVDEQGAAVILKDVYKRQVQQDQGAADGADRAVVFGQSCESTAESCKKRFDFFIHCYHLLH